MSAEALLSRSDGTDEIVDLQRVALRPRDQLLWIDIVDGDGAEVDRIADVLDLSDEAADALRGELEAPRASVRDGAIEVVVRFVDLDEADIETGLVQILVGHGWVVTRHDRPVRSLAEHRASIQDQREVGRLTAAEFLAELLDWLIVAFLDAAESIAGDVEQLDDAALRRDADLLDRLVAMRRRTAAIRRAMGQQRDVFAELTRPDFLPARHRAATDAIRALLPRLDRAADAIDNAREMLMGTFDIHMTRTAQRTNDIMRVLTLASVVLLPSVVIAGVMGMNFRIGFFEPASGFWIVLAAMVALAGATLGLAAWRRWL